MFTWYEADLHYIVSERCLTDNVLIILHHFWTWRLALLYLRLKRRGARQAPPLARADSSLRPRETFFSRSSSRFITDGAWARTLHHVSEKRVRVGLVDYTDGECAREETWRVLQRERLPREVRVAMPQPSHHAHLCCIQTLPGMTVFLFTTN